MTISDCVVYHAHNMHTRCHTDHLKGLEGGLAFHIHVPKLWHVAEFYVTVVLFFVL